MPTRNINLTERLDQFVAEGVDSGKYGNASEVVREALRLMLERDSEYQAKLDWLRGAIAEGQEQIRQGKFKRFRSVGALRTHLQKLGQRAVARAEADRA